MTVTAEDIKALGFSASMYSIDESVLDTRIAAVITEQSAILSERVGSAAFSLEANQQAVDQVVKLWTAAEMARRRILAMSANTVFSNAEGGEALHLERLIKEWEAKAEQWINKIVDGSLADAGGFATGYSVSESDNRMTHPES